MDGPPIIFDRKLLEARRRRAEAAGASDFLLRHATADLIDRLSTVQKRFPLAADIGTPLPILAAALAASGRADLVVRLAGGGPLAVAPVLDVRGDEERPPFRAASLDLAVSALALQFVNDVPGVLLQIRRALRPDGLFLGVFAGGATLHELGEAFAAAEAEIVGGASPRIAPFVEVRAAGALLQRAGFALPVADQDRVTVRYADPLGLIRDLRAMGATNVLGERSRRPLRRDVFLRAMAEYARRHADPDGRVRASFDLVWLSGWAPHDSQQQPLRPGSARVRLADALGTTERPTEKPG